MNNSAAAKSAAAAMPPQGWHLDEATGAWMRDTIHRMGRRCHHWDYFGRAAYLITMTLADRRRPLFGELVVNSAGAHIALLPLGEAIAAHVARIPEFSPEIEILAFQVMPEHLHIVLRVKRRMSQPLGYALRGFKGGASKIFWSLAAMDEHKPLFASGFVDNILFDERAIKAAIAYVRDNPRRLAEKRANPALFKVLRDLEMEIALGETNVKAHFSAIGNHALLSAPVRLQVQCSRSFFAYRRDGKGNLLKEVPPTVETPEFREKRDALLAAAEHGAVLVSPCISEGEREIARLAFRAGRRVVTLSNKGFSPLYKPGGQFFELCAAGNLLMLAPAAWPYLPGEKRMTREDACVLNRLAQAIAGSGAVEIVYKGIVPKRVDELAMAAVKAPCE